jgi:hypothetical protein
MRRVLHISLIIIGGTMRKLFLYAALCIFAGQLFAQQQTVRVPYRSDLQFNSVYQLFAPTGKLIQHEGSSSGKHHTTVQKALNSVVQIGAMANTYATLGQDRLQIACDPATSTVSICYRGNDRVTSSSVGNKLYVRYSSDHGETWSGPPSTTTNMAEGISASPRYPQVFLFNPSQAASTSSVKSILMWPQTITYAGVTNPTWGELNIMSAGYGSTAPLYSKWPTPPNWSIPSRIVPAYGVGKIYSMCDAVEPSNGTSINEYYMLESSDGKVWTQTNSNTAALVAANIPTGLGVYSLNYDVSPDGTHMIVAFILATQSGTGYPYLSPDHSIGYVESTDAGATWTTNPSTVSLSATTNVHVPGVFSGTPQICLQDLDVIYDANNEPHFLICASGDINPYDPRADGGVAGKDINNIEYVDSTYMTEVARKGAEYNVYPIAKVHRPITQRRSFSQQYTGTSGTYEVYEVFQHEPQWARSIDGKKLYAKWIDVDSTLKAPYAFYYADSTLGIVLDTIHNISVAGKHIDSKTVTGGWGPAQKITNQTDVGAKYTKLARLAGNGGELHTFYTQWGQSDNAADDSPINDDCYIQYVKGVKVEAIVPTDKPGQVSDFTLAQNYPNPFNPSTSIRFSIPSNGLTKLKVFNLLGREVATVFDGVLEAGSHAITFQAKDLPSGLYTYRLEYGKQMISKKMVLMK